MNIVVLTLGALFLVMILVVAVVKVKSQESWGVALKKTVNQFIDIWPL